MAVDVGQQAPGFTLLNGAGDEVSLSDFCGKNVIVAFFPAVFSGVCDNEMCTFRDSLSELNDADADVIGISGGPALGDWRVRIQVRTDVSCPERLQPPGDT